MGFETPEEGYLAKIIIPAGTKNVAIGKLVCIIVESESDIAAFKEFKDDGATVAPPSAPASAPPTSSQPPPVTSAPSPASTSSPPISLGSMPSGERVYASPLAKRIAAEKGLNLQVTVT